MGDSAGAHAGRLFRLIGFRVRYVNLPVRDVRAFCLNVNFVANYLDPNCLVNFVVNRFDSSSSLEIAVVALRWPTAGT